MLPRYLSGCKCVLTQYSGVIYSYFEFNKKKSPFHLGKTEAFLNEVVWVRKWDVLASGGRTNQGLHQVVEAG